MACLLPRRAGVEREERRDLNFERQSDRATPRVIVKAILRPPAVDPLIAQALIARYVPPEDR